MNFVNALNALNGRVWLGVVVLLLMMLLFLRYRNVTPTGSFIDSLNSVHVAWLGFTLCLCGVALMISGQGEYGDKVFLSGASFIGGIAATKAVNGSANGNGATGPNGH